MQRAHVELDSTARIKDFSICGTPHFLGLYGWLHMNVTFLTTMREHPKTVLNDFDIYAHPLYCSYTSHVGYWKADTDLNLSRFAEEVTVA